MYSYGLGVDSLERKAAENFALYFRRRQVIVSALLELPIKSTPLLAALQWGAWTAHSTATRPAGCAGRFPAPLTLPSLFPRRSYPHPPRPHPQPLPPPPSPLVTAGPPGSHRTARDQGGAPQEERQAYEIAHSGAAALDSA
jgi:hypothetical protein